MAKVNQEEINAEFKSAVDNYSNSIKTIKSEVEAVRKNPGVYCSGLGDRGFLSLIREVFQNSIDQIIMEESPASFVDVYYNEQTLEVVIRDNGLGFPFQDIERIVNKMNTSKNYEKVKGKFSIGTHGMGVKAVNFLSAEFDAESYRYDGTAIRFSTISGCPVKSTKDKPNPRPIPNKDKFQGSLVRFIPDVGVLGEINLSWKEVYTLVSQIISRTPIGTLCNFEAIDKNGVSHKEQLLNRDGIITDLVNMSKKPICKPITIFGDNGYMRLNMAFIFDGEDSPILRCVSYCNMCPTVAGTHIDGTVDGISRWFTKYMNDLYLSSTKSKVKVISSDIKSNIIISIAADVLEPVFIGQAKEQLANKEMAQYCRDVVIDNLNTWSKENPAELTKICKYLKEVAEMRARNDKVKETIVNKFQANAVTGYPAKFARPLKQKKEFVIVEGDSAAGSVKEGRDRNTTGLFPIRGKLPNAFRTTRSKMFENQEVQGIFKCILNCPYKKDFDPYKDVPWEKVIIMADADPDR
jgi:DNA gyrase/topoisomerase IV subunit B